MRRNAVGWITTIMLSSLVHSLLNEKTFIIGDTPRPIQCIAVYGDSLLSTAFNDIIQRDIETGAIQRTLRGHTDYIYTLLVISDSRMITTAYDDYVIVWDLLSATVIRRIKLTPPGSKVTAIALKDDQIIIGGYDSRLRQIDLSSGEIVTSTRVISYVNAIVVVGEHIFIGLYFLTAHIEKREIGSLKIVASYTFHEGSVHALIYHNGLIYSGSGDEQIVCFDPETGNVVRRFSGQKDLISALLIHNEELYSGGYSGSIFKWNIESGEIITKFSNVHAIAVGSFATQDNFIYSAASENLIVKWNITSGEPFYIYKTRNKKIVTIVNWKTFLLVGKDEAEIELWATSISTLDSEARFVAHSQDITCLIVFGDFLYSGSSDNSIKQWNLVNLMPLQKFLGHSAPVRAIAADGNFLYSGGDDIDIRKWNVSSGFFVANFSGHTESVLLILLQNDFLYSNSYDNSIRMWDVNKPENVQSFSDIFIVSAIGVIEDMLIVGGALSTKSYSITSGDVLIEYEESILSTTLCVNGLELYTGHGDGIIRSRNTYSLIVLETFFGHTSDVNAIRFDFSGSMYSASSDGSIHKWNLKSRRIAYSFENKNESVTSLVSFDNYLIVGLKNGDVNTFTVDDTLFFRKFRLHSNSVKSLIHDGTKLYSSGADGIVKVSTFNEGLSCNVLFNATRMSLKSLGLSNNKMVLILDSMSIVILSQNSTKFLKKDVIASSVPLLSLAIKDDFIVAGSHSGVVFAWNIETLQIEFKLVGHTSQVNSVLLTDDLVISASDDKSIIIWSLKQQLVLRTLKRISFTSLGHLSAVNCLYLCGNSILSGGADNSLRVWDVNSGAHEDIFLGFSKPVTAIYCNNHSSFAGSEDNSVFMFPLESFQNEMSSTTGLARPTRRNPNNAKVVNIQRDSFTRSQFLNIMIATASILFITTAFAVVRYYRRKDIRSTPVESSAQETNTAITDLETVINSVIGISKHAAYLMESSVVAKMKKISAGGGGELFLAKITDPSLKKKIDEIVVQKVVFVKSKVHFEAFYQEAGIMIMLSGFPNICKIFGYTENPPSMILKYYSSGSLSDLIRRDDLKLTVIMKILKEISMALSVMHSYYLAHCDVKPQNVLVELVDNIPTCYVTDFGITQILSDSIIASRLFNVTNLRGLSIYYASPEAFSNFRSKQFSKADLKKYDIYSLSCVILEILNKNTPWS